MCVCDSECMQNKYALQFTHALKNMKKKTPHDFQDISFSLEMDQVPNFIYKKC